MAYTLLRRIPRCDYLHCRSRATMRLYSRILGVDSDFCEEHGYQLLHAYPGAIRFDGHPAERRSRRRRVLARHRAPAVR